MRSALLGAVVVLLGGTVNTAAITTGEATARFTGSLSSNGGPDAWEEVGYSYQMLVDGSGYLPDFQRGFFGDHTVTSSSVDYADTAAFGTALQEGSIDASASARIEVPVGSYAFGQAYVHARYMPVQQGQSFTVSGRLHYSFAVGDADPANFLMARSWVGTGLLAVWWLKNDDGSWAYGGERTLGYDEHAAWATASQPEGQGVVDFEHIYSDAGYVPPVPEGATYRLDLWGQVFLSAAVAGEGSGSAVPDPSGPSAFELLAFVAALWALRLQSRACSQP